MTAASHHVRRVLLVVAASAIALAAVPLPVAAIGAQGVDLEPLLRRVDGKLTAYLDQPTTTIQLHLENLTDEARTVSIFVASTPRNAEGGLTVGLPVPWATLPDGGDISLAPQEERIIDAQVDLAGFRDAETPRNAAIVLQVGAGSTIVPRAATIITLVDGGAPLPVSIILLLAAAGLIVIVGAFWVRTVRTYGLRPSPVPSTAIRPPTLV